MKNSILLFSVLAATLVLSGLLAGNPPVLNGSWELSMTAILPNQTTCGFQGSAQVTQTDGMIMGTATLRRVSGPSESCPTTMTASLSGVLEGDRVIGTLDGGAAFGMAQFDGTVGPEGMSLTGSFFTETLDEATEGATAKAAPAGPPFPGINGNWQAQIQVAREIPVLGGMALAALVALLLISSYALLQRSAA